MQYSSRDSASPWYISPYLVLCAMALELASCSLYSHTLMSVRICSSSTRKEGCSWTKQRRVSLSTHGRLTSQKGYNLTISQNREGEETVTTFVVTGDGLLLVLYLVVGKLFFMLASSAQWRNMDLCTSLLTGKFCNSCLVFDAGDSESSPWFSIFCIVGIVLFYGLLNKSHLKTQ